MRSKGTGSLRPRTRAKSGRIAGEREEKVLTFGVAASLRDEVGDGVRRAGSVARDCRSTRPMSCRSGGKGSRREDSRSESGASSSSDSAGGVATESGSIGRTTGASRA